MDVVIKGRHCEVSDRFRDFVTEKLAKLERYDHRTLRIDVEVDAEPNSRLPSEAERIEITAHSRGPAIRVEAAAEERHVAFDQAFARLETKLRKAADRRRVHYGARRPASLAEATAVQSDGALDSRIDGYGGSGVNSATHGDESQSQYAEGRGPVESDGDGDAYADSPVVVRQKTHAAHPMTLDQALYEMELVGHDFFLFVDETTKTPSVVYRRRAYDYGVIHLDVQDG